MAYLFFIGCSQLYSYIYMISFSFAFRAKQLQMSSRLYDDISGYAFFSFNLSKQNCIGCKSISKINYNFFWSNLKWNVLQWIKSKERNIACILYFASKLQRIFLWFRFMSLLMLTETFFSIRSVQIYCRFRRIFPIYFFLSCLYAQRAMSFFLFGWQSKIANIENCVFVIAFVEEGK